MKPSTSQLSIEKCVPSDSFLSILTAFNTENFYVQFWNPKTDDSVKLNSIVVIHIWKEKNGIFFLHSIFPFIEPYNTAQKNVTD